MTSLRQETWDTEFFGFPVASLRPASIADLHNGAAAADASGVACTYCSIPSDEPALLAAAQDCGLGGFVVSGRSELSDPHPQAIEILDCRAVDCGRPELPNTTFGFGVLRARPDPDYPRRVRFVRCEASDLRARAGMKWGFFNEIAAEGEDRNLVEDCTAFGASVAPFYGFGRRHS